MMGWSNLGVVKDRRTGDWIPVRIIIIRNILHVLNVINNNIDNETDVTKQQLESATKYKLKQFKLEVGKCQKSNYSCLFLVSGFSKVTLGFKSSDLLEVHDHDYKQSKGQSKQ